MVEGNGFTITGGGTTIRGLVINRFKEEDTATLDGCGIFLPNLAANTNNVIEGNFIGTDVSGTQKLGNESPGVCSFGQSINNLIGGTTLASRNLLSGNGRDGVAIDSSQNTVQGNLIGTDKGGTQNLGNGSSGVEVAGSGNLVRDNTIAFNASDGVTVFFDTSTGNRILKNSIFDNVGLGIDLNDDGVTKNDAMDVDTGPNDLQNYPVFGRRGVKTSSSGTTTIKGKLNSTPNTTFTVQFFSNPLDSKEEGKTFIGEKTDVTTDGSGNATFIFKPTQAVPVGQFVTATATDPSGDTSEFSTPRKVRKSS
jgi:titin